MHVCVCVHECACVCERLQVHVCNCVCVCVRAHVHMRLRVHVCACVRRHVKFLCGRDLFAWCARVCVPYVFEHVSNSKHVCFTACVCKRVCM